jgi:hypothetical protein
VLASDSDGLVAEIREALDDAGKQQNGKDKAG